MTLYDFLITKSTLFLFQSEMSDIRMFAPSVDRLVEDGQEIIEQNGEDSALTNTLEG